MTYPGKPHGRRDRLQARLEVAVGLGELSIEEYDSLCARVWDAASDDDSPELDAIAGRLERIEQNRPQQGTVGHGTVGNGGTGGVPGHGVAGAGHGVAGHGALGHGGEHGTRGSSPNPYGPTRHDAVARGADQPYAASFGRSTAPARFTISDSPDTPRQNGTATIFGSKEMSGWWSPKNETTWWSVFGELKLDLSRAELPSTNIVLDLQSFFSEIVITVPSGTRVIMDMTTPMTEVINHLNPNAQPNGLTVILDGIVMFGEIKIRED